MAKATTPGNEAPRSTDTAEPALNSALRDLGFYRLTDDLPALCHTARTLAAQAGSAILDEKFEAFPSYIPAQPAPPLAAPILVVDIGGTSAKAGVRTGVVEGVEQWQFLFEAKHDKLNSPAAFPTPLHNYADQLARAVARNLNEKNMNQLDSQHLSIVWSNAIDTQPLENRGVTGIISKAERYVKGEYFVEGLKNGTDLGQILLESFARHGLPIKQILISNDTCLTMKASPGSSAGMVAATGLNATLIKSLAQLGLGSDNVGIICNSEMGNKFSINPELLSTGDWYAHGKRANSIETLIAGRFLPGLFTCHILTLSEKTQPELLPLARALKQLGSGAYTHFSARDIADCFMNPTEFVATKNQGDLYTPSVMVTLGQLGQELYKRAGRLAAVVAYGSICDQPDRSEPFIVALDSSLARTTPVFAEELRKTCEILSLPGHNFRCELVQPINTPGGKISVPMRGAAFAMDSLSAVA